MFSLIGPIQPYSLGILGQYWWDMETSISSSQLPQGLQGKILLPYAALFAINQINAFFVQLVIQATLNDTSGYIAIDDVTSAASCVIEPPDAVPPPPTLPRK